MYIIVSISIIIQFIIYICIEFPDSIYFSKMYTINSMLRVQLFFTCLTLVGWDGTLAFLVFTASAIGIAISVADLQVK